MAKMAKTAAISRFGRPENVNQSLPPNPSKSRT
jgi:hypothetical protein